MNTNYKGAIDDNRLIEEKLRDFKVEEAIATFTPVEWKEKPESEWRRFSIRNQDGSGSCVAQTAAKMLGIENFLEEGRFIDFSARDIYAQRINLGSPGMVGYDVMDIIKKKGATFEEFMPSQNLNEVKMDKANDRKESDKRIAQVFRTNGYIQLPINDIDKLASIIATGKGIMTWYRFGSGEWTDIPEVKDNNPQNHHSVIGIDYFLWKGKKCILIEDSWGEFYGLNGQRIITEDFLKQRCTYNAYLLSKSNKDIDSEKPKYEFKNGLKFSEIFIVNEEVKWLQKCLKYDGVFPKNIDITGYYGAITAKAIYDFQKKYSVASQQELDSIVPKGGIVGPKTLKMLNELYA